MKINNIDIDSIKLEELEDIVNYHLNIFGIEDDIDRTKYLKIKQELFTIINFFSLLDRNFENRLLRLLLKDVLSLILYFDKLSDAFKLDKDNDRKKYFTEIKEKIIQIINTKIHFLCLYSWERVNESNIIKAHIRQKYSRRVWNMLEFLELNENEFEPCIDINYKLHDINLKVEYDIEDIVSIKYIDLYQDMEEDLITEKLIDARRNISFFKNMAPDDIRHVVKDVKFLRYEANEMIIRQNEDSKEVYFLLSGKCKVQIDNSTVAIIEANELFGEFTSLLDEKRNADIKAMQSVAVLRFKFAFELFKEEPYFFTMLYKNIIDQLIKKIKKSNNRR